MDLKFKCCGMTVKRLVIAAVSVTRKDTHSTNNKGPENDTDCVKVSGI
jgi:hypothetical protein